MNAEEYLSERLEDQISWYNTKSQNAQLKFKILRVVEFICAAMIPLIAGFNLVGAYSVVTVSSLGVAIAICAALIGLGNYQENWIEYRTTSESLKHEKYLFLTKTVPYDTENAFGLLVQRVEGMVSKENSAWSQHTRAQSRGTSPGQPK